MMSEIIQGLILTYIEASCCSIFFGTFLPLRFPKKRWMNQAVILMLAILSVIITILLMERPVIKAIMAVGIIAIAMSILYQCHVKQVLFFSSAFYGIVLAIDIGLLEILKYAWNGNPFEMMNPVRVMVLAILCKAILFLCIVFIRGKFSRAIPYELPEDYEWALFIFFPIFTVVAVLLFFVDGGDGGRAVLLVSFGLIMANLILFYVLREFVARSRESREASLMQEQTKSRMELYESIEAAYNEQKEKVHEFQHHVDCIQGLLLEDDKEGAFEYVNGINDKIELNVNRYDTAHPIINAVINQKHRQAKKEGMAMVLILDKLDGVRIENEDLVVLLSNLLDNAMEACRRLKKEERLIRFRFVQDGEQIVIATKNPVKDPIKITDGKIATTKENKIQHGIGLSNIKRVVEKYDGEDMLSCHDGFFYYTIIFEKQNLQGG